jgi:hypothetical protein
MYGAPNYDATPLYAKNYGVVMDGVTDDTAALNALIALANAQTSGATIILAGGLKGQIVKISSALTTLSSSTAIKGSTWGATTILSSDLSHNIITINGGNISVEDITLQYTAQATGGHALYATGSSAIRVRGCSTVNAFASFSFLDTNTVWIEDCTVVGATGSLNGIVIDSSTGLSSQYYIKNCILYGGSGGTFAGGSAVKLATCQSVFLDSVYAYSWQYGVTFNPSVTSSATYNVFLDKCYFVGNENYGCYMNPGTNQKTSSVRFSNCAFSGTTAGPGFYATGAPSGSLVDDIQMSNCEFANNSTFGVNLSSTVTTFHLSNPTIAANGTSGLAIGPNCAVVVTGGKIGNIPSFPSGTYTQQPVGFSTSTGCYIVMTGVNCLNNTTYSWAGTPSTSSLCKFTACLGVNAAGGLTLLQATGSSSFPASGTATTNHAGLDVSMYVSGGTVTAVAVSGVTTGLTSGNFYIPSGSAFTLTYSVAPTLVFIAL